MIYKKYYIGTDIQRRPISPSS